MSIELLFLSLTAILCLAIPLIYSPIYASQVGMKGLTGNRDDVPEPIGIAGRGIRAHRNLLENLMPFALAVLIAHVSDITNIWTIGAAIIFFAARVVHAASYIAGIKILRTIAYNAGVISTLVFFYQSIFGVAN